MPIDPFQFPTSNYGGTPFRQNMKYCTAPSEPPAFSRLSITWAAYGVSASTPNATVKVDLQATGINTAGNPLSGIRGCYIDNTDSDLAVTVYFPDTEFTLTCPPFAIASGPVFTGVLQCLIIGENGGTDDDSVTNVFLTNTPVPSGFNPQLNYNYPQWRCSPQFERGLNLFTNGYTSPAIGDQWQFLSVPISTLPLTFNLFGTPYANGGWITLTDFATGINPSGTSPNALQGSAVASLGLGGTLFDVRVYDSNTLFTPWTETGLQHKLNASETWQWTPTKLANSSGSIWLKVGYSYQGPGGGTQTGNFGTGNQATVNYVNVGSGAITWAGFQFTPTNAIGITSADFGRANSQGGNVTIQCYIYDDNAGSPGNLIGTAIPLTVPNNTGHEIYLQFPTPVALQPNTTYWCIIGAPAGNYMQNVPVCAAVAGYKSGRANTIAGISNGSNMPGTTLMTCQLTFNYL